MAEVLFLPAADYDYREALARYQSRSAQAAAGFEAALGVALERIGDRPELWPLCDDRHRCYLLKRFPYLVIYRIESRGPLVVAVAHAHRPPRYWQGR